MSESTETNKERYDRELIELLNELKVALPGVQVMFAFLLAVPLSPVFKDVNGFEKAIFFATLACTAIATAFLIAPSAIHRIDFRNKDKGSMIILFNRISIYGLIFTALSMVGALTFIADLLYGEVRDDRHRDAFDCDVRRLLVRAADPSAHAAARRRALPISSRPRRPQTSAPHRR